MVVANKNAPFRADQDGILERFFSEFLDESAFSKFRYVQRQIESLKLQGQTVSGYPLIRPADCGRIIASLSDIFETSQPHFRTRDPEITERFERLISEFLEFCRKVYPSEAINGIVLHGRVRLFMGDAKGALAIVEHFALRPYAVEGGVENCIQLIEIFAQAHLQLGTLEEQNISFIALGRWLASFREQYSPAAAAARVAPFSAFGRSGENPVQVAASRAIVRQDQAERLSGHSRSLLSLSAAPRARSQSFRTDAQP